MRTLREDGWMKVKEGITTVSEVIRVTQEEQVM
jgi:type II secretory ATPase GspE/PulE/Tfp pilus assembly ATPase PilB-like protein